MAFSRARVSRDHETLLALYEVQLRDLNHLSLIHSGLEYEVEVGKKFPLGELCVFYPALYPPLDLGVGLYGEQPLNQFRRRQRLLYGTGKLLIKDLLYTQKLQCFQVAPDLRDGLFLLHRLSPV